MNKKIALVTLIEASVLLSDIDKLALINRVPSFTDRQVDIIGKYLSAERTFVLAHKEELIKHFDQLLAELDQEPPQTVYIGTGKPS